MKVGQFSTVRFAPKTEGGFFATVTALVNEYFETNGISRYANTKMWVKTTLMLVLYFFPYALMVTGVGMGVWLFFGFWFLMGWGMVGIGTSVMHDANHGTYSPNKKVNNLIGYILEIVGGYTVTWKIQHNVLHHTYTNIVGLDEDIRQHEAVAIFSQAAPLLVSPVSIHICLVFLHDHDIILDDYKGLSPGHPLQAA